MATEGQKEACKTYLEQTKLLVTLASAFLFAPAGLIGILQDRSSINLASGQLEWFMAAEVLFIASVLAGYVAIASITGSQAIEEYDVYRPATRISSTIQFFSYLIGLAVFTVFALRIIIS